MPIFQKKDANDDNFDLRGDIIRNCEPYYDGLFQTNEMQKSLNCQNLKLMF